MNRPEKGQGFVPVDKYPQIKTLCDRVLDNFERLEKIERYMPYISWPEIFLYKKGWTAAPLRYMWRDYNPLFSFLNDDLIQTAGFSKLAGGTEVIPHKGYAGDVFRIHLGIVVPEGDVDAIGIRAEQDKTQWKRGEFLMFSDLDEHEAWNRTEEDRLILILDVPKDKLIELDPIDKRSDWRESDPNSDEYKAGDILSAHRR